MKLSWLRDSQEQYQEVIPDQSTSTLPRDDRQAMADDAQLQDVREDIRLLASQQSLSSTLMNEQRLRRIADASRESNNIRHALGQPDALRVLTSYLFEHRGDVTGDGVGTEVLRCVGNGIANNQSAVEAIADEGLAWLKPYLISSNKATRTLAAKVLYNIYAVDFEDENPVWKRCFEDKLYLDVIDILSTVDPTDEVTRLLVDVLFWTTCSDSSEDDSPDGTESTNDAPGFPLQSNRLWPLLDVPWFETFAMNLDEESLASLVESTIVLLRPTNVRRDLISQGKFSQLFQVFQALDRRLVAAASRSSPAGETSTDAQDVVMATSHSVEDAEVEDGALLVPQVTSFVWLLSDISSQSIFGQTESTQLPALDPVVEVLLKSNDSTVTDRGLQATCLVIGNALLGTSESDTIHLLARKDLAGASITAALRQDASPDLLHAIAGLLTVLCRPSIAVREAIAQRPELQLVMRKLCLHESPLIRKEGMRTLRALGRDSPVVQRLFSGLISEVEVSLAVERSDNQDAGAVNV